MSIAYIKFKAKRDIVTHIVKEFLQKYPEYIEAYDVQDVGVIDFTDPSIEVEERSVIRKGGSLMVTIPSPFVQYLNMYHTSRMLFVKHKKIGVVYLFPATKIIAYSK